MEKSRIILYSVTGLLLAGCQNFPKTQGEVSVSRPQVFTRERLVNERLGEVNWLRDQLERPFEHGFQGFRDVRAAAAFVVELQAKFDGAQRRAAGLSDADKDAQHERNQELADIRHEIEKTQLQKQLDQLKKSTTSAPPTAPVPADVNNQLTQLSKDVTALDNSIKLLEGKLSPANAKSDGIAGAARGLFENSQSRVLNPNLAERTRASLSSRDRLEDESAFRDLVNGRIREAILDDTHDLNGFSLFEFKFDATIVPGSNTRRSAIAELSIQKDEFDLDKLRVGGFSARLTRLSEEDVNAQIMRQQDRADVFKLNQTWQRRILNTHLRSEADGACRNPRKVSPDELFRYMNPATAAMRDSATGRAKAEMGLAADFDPPAELTRCLITEYMRQRLVLALGGYFEFTTVADANAPPGKSRPLLKVTMRSPNGIDTLIATLKGLATRASPWVATVSPKEYAQNISDVSSDLQIRQISAMLGASDGKGASADARADSYKQEQSIAQAIKRQPLAASFVRGSDKFGWVLGPKYEIKGTTPSFVHATARYTFTASVAVPGWFSEIGLTGCGYWVDADGSRSAGFPLFGGTDCTTTVKIALPHGYRAILHALMDTNADILTDPEIYLLGDSEPTSGKVTLRATPDACLASSDKSCEQLLVIEGRDLWRNPSVFIGNQRADRVDVLPSMRGIVATFRSLRLPAAAAGGRVRAQDLFVSTSAGQDRLDDAVFIATASAAPTKPFARLTRHYVEIGGANSKDALEVAFEFPSASFPRAYSAIALRIHKLGSKDSKLIETDPSLSVGRLIYNIVDPASAGFGSTSAEFEFDLLFKFAPGDEWLSMTEPSARLATYYANSAERQITAAPETNADFSASHVFGDAQLKTLQQALRFTLPVNESLFFKAYPGLAEALSERGGSVNIGLQFDEATDAVQFTAERTTVKGRSVIQPRFTALNAKALEMVPEDERSITYKLNVSYRRGGGDVIEVPMTSAAQLTAKGLKKPPEPVKTAAKP